MRKLFPLIALIVASLLGSCTKSEETEENHVPDTAESPLAKALKDGMIKLSKDIGDWDVAVIFRENGYLLQKTERDADGRPTIFTQIVSPDGDYDCAFYTNSDNFMPEILMTEDGVIHFESIGDTMVLVARSKEAGTGIIDSIDVKTEDKAARLTRGGHATTITYERKDDKVKKAVKALDAVVNAGTDYDSDKIRKLKRALDNISLFYYYANVEDIVDSLQLCREAYEDNPDSMVYCFAQYATKVKVRKYDPIRYALYVATDRATSVHARSATVGGQLFCKSEGFREKGQWGIIYSESHDNLSLQHYGGIVYANADGSKNFRIRIAGLKPGTRYYYKAFYKFSSKDHGDIVFSYGKRDAEEYVDSWYHSFVTPEATEEEEDDNGIDVEIDNLRISIDEATSYSVTFKVDFSVNWDAPKDAITTCGYYIRQHRITEKYNYYKVTDMSNHSSAKSRTFQIFRNQFTSVDEDKQIAICNSYAIGAYYRDKDSVIHRLKERPLRLVYDRKPSLEYVSARILDSHSITMGGMRFVTESEFEVAAWGTFWMEHIWKYIWAQNGNWHFINENGEAIGNSAELVVRDGRSTLPNHSHYDKNSTLDFYEYLQAQLRNGKTIECPNRLHYYGQSSIERVDVVEYIP